MILQKLKQLKLFFGDIMIEIQLTRDKKTIVDELDKDLFDEEFRKLTEIGNSYRIRHHETDKKAIEKNKNINYLFFRMLSLIDLCIENINESA